MKSQYNKMVLSLWAFPSPALNRKEGLDRARRWKPIFAWLDPRTVWTDQDVILCVIWEEVLIQTNTSVIRKTKAVRPRHIQSQDSESSNYPSLEITSFFVYVWSLKTWLCSSYLSHYLIGRDNLTADISFVFSFKKYCISHSFRIPLMHILPFYIAF